MTIYGSFQSFELIISWSEIQVPCHQMGPETPMRSNKRIEIEVRCPNLFPSLDLDVGNSKGEVCTKHDTNIFQQIVSNQSAPKHDIPKIPAKNTPKHPPPSPKVPKSFSSLGRCWSVLRSVLNLKKFSMWYWSWVVPTMCCRTYRGR